MFLCSVVCKGNNSVKIEALNVQSIYDIHAIRTVHVPKADCAKSFKNCNPKWVFR